MKIYIGYRYTGADKELLKQFLTQISSAFEQSGHTTFMYFRDGGNWQKQEGAIPLDKVMRDCFVAIKESDTVVILVQSSTLSEGMLLDIGYALANGKKLIILKAQGASLPKSETLANQIIEYTDQEDLIPQLKNI